MIKAIVGLTSALALAATCADAAPSFGSFSLSAKTGRAHEGAKASPDEFTLWAWAQKFLGQALVRTADDQPQTAGAPADGESVADAAGNPPKTAPDRKKPADKDDAREKTGPEPLPLAF